MPPSDPRLCPDLELARPADSDVTTDYRMAREPWEAMFGDGNPHPVEARAWWLDRLARWVVKVEWSVSGDSFGEAYLYDPEKMRPAVDGGWLPPRPSAGGVAGINLRARCLSGFHVSGTGRAGYGSPRGARPSGAVAARAVVPA